MKQQNNFGHKINVNTFSKRKVLNAKRLQIIVNEAT